MRVLALLLLLAAAPVLADEARPASLTGDHGVAMAAVAEYYEAVRVGDAARLDRVLAPTWALTSHVPGEAALDRDALLARVARYDFVVHSALPMGELIAVKVRATDRATGDGYDFLHLHRVDAEGRIAHTWRTQQVPLAEPAP